MRPLVCLLCVLTAALQCRAARGGEGAERKTLAALRIAERVTVDGRLGEPCWARAPAATGFVQLRGREPAREQTTGRVLFDDENLFIGVACDEPRMDLVRAAAERNCGRFDYEQGETIEIFLDVTRERKAFLQIMLNTNGTLRTYASEAMQITGLEIERGVCLSEAGFSMECRIPFALLHPQRNQERIWGFNLCRTRMIEGRPGVVMPVPLVHSAWQNPGSGFRDPARFGDLTLDVDLSPYCYAVDVQRGPGTAQLVIANRTSAARDLVIEVAAAPSGGSRTESIALAPDGRHTVELPMSGGDVEVKLTMKEKSSGKVVFCGGTRLAEVSFAVPAGPAGGVAAAEGDYVVFAKHYLERGNHRTVPRPDQVGHPLDLFAAPGEYEPVTLAVRAAKALAAVQVEMAGDLRGPGGAAIPKDRVEVRIAELMTRWLDAGTFERVECYLIRNRPLDIPADTTRRFWLTVHVPEAAAPGLYEAGVRVAPRNSPAQTVPLRVEVLPAPLCRPEGMNYFMYFNLGYFPPALRTPEYVRRMYCDMREHGMTTATVYAYPAAPGWVSVERDRPGLLPMATQLDLLRDTGLVAEWGAVPWIGAESFAVEVWKVVVESARRRGWPELLWYLVDEPSDERMPRVEKAMGKVAEFRKRYPEYPLRTTTAGASNPKCAHYYDVWIAGCYIDEATIARGRQMGKTIWTYDCGLAPVDAITDRHYFGIWTWAAGLQGASHWAYYDGGMRNRWGVQSAWRDDESDLREYTHDFNYVYPASGEIISSVGWEAVREGVDDARYLITLEKALRAAKQANLPPDVLRPAEATLAGVRAAVHVNNLGEERTRCKRVTAETGRPQVRDFERKPPEPGLGPADYDRLRRQVAAQIVALCEALRARGVMFDPGKRPAARPDAAPTVLAGTPPPRAAAPADLQQSLVEPCEDVAKINPTFRQPYWDPKGTHSSRVGTRTVAKDQKVQGEGSIHWVVTQRDVEERRKGKGFDLASLDYLYGKRWGEVAEVAFHVKCENPQHPAVFAMLSASGASPSRQILERGETTNGWKEIRWDVRKAEIGVSEKWGKIVWMFRFYSRADAFNPGDTLDLYLDNIRLVASPPKDVTAIAR